MREDTLAINVPCCEPQIQGFWRHECKDPDDPHGGGSEEHDNLPIYLDCVNSTGTFGGVDDVAEMCDRLTPGGNKCASAEVEFMTLMLNSCSGRLSETCCIETNVAGTVGDAIALIDDLLSNPKRTVRDCGRALSLAASINRGSRFCPEDEN